MQANERDAIATFVVVAGTAGLVAAADHFSSGALRAPLPYAVPVALATWRSGAQVGLSVAVLVSVATLLLGRSEPDVAELLARAVDLATWSIVVTLVAKARDHLRIWPEDVLSGRSLDAFVRRLRYELDRLSTGAGPIAIARVRVRRRGEPLDRLEPIVLAMQAECRAHDALVPVGTDVLLLLPDTDGPAARLAVQRHRERIEETSPEIGGPLETSIGVVTFHRRVSPERALLRSIEALTLAMRVGDSQIVVVERRPRPPA